MNFHRSLVAQNLLALCFAVPLFTSAQASAQEACGDQVCPKGYQCETYDLGCPAIDRGDGDDAGDAAEFAPCEPSVAQGCVPSTCTSDADCGSGMVCHTETRQECDESPGCTGADPGDDAGGAEDEASDAEKAADCAPAAPTNCTTVSTSICAPRWAVPCTAAADCGPGFTCEEQLQGGCSGSMGSAGGGTPSDGGEPTPGDGDDAAEPAPPDGGETPAPEPPDCVFEPSGVSMCVAIEVGCTTNDDCLEGWTCEDNSEGVCWSGADGTSGCEPADPAKVCAPPYSRIDGPGGFAEDGSGGPATGGDDDGNGAPPTAPRGEDPANADGDSGKTTEAGGCALSPARGTGSELGLLALALGALFGVRRRRAAR
ncbi:MAG TPA: hypothetical protein VGK73_39900 [Polyangiaceae bacterium]